MRAVGAASTPGLHWRGRGFSGGAVVRLGEGMGEGGYLTA